MTERSISRASSDPAIPSKATQTSSPATTAPTAPARPSRSSLAQRRGNACDLPWNVKLSNRVDQLIGKIRGIKELLASFGEAKTLREFQEILALAKDQGTIELALVRAVSALTDAALVELMIDSAQAYLVSDRRLAGFGDALDTQGSRRARLSAFLGALVR